jgi:hypothetical protein
MNFISTECPHCGKELQIPEDSENIVCMYCAKPIDVKALLFHPAPESGSYQELMAEAESLLNEDIFSKRIKMRNLKSSTYPDEFQEYAALLIPALRAYSLAATENQEAAEHFAEVLFNRFLKHIETEGIKKESDPRFFDIRYTIVVFTVPAILSYKTPAAEALADRFLEKWNEYYPKNKLGKSSFEAINGGFRKKLCFITTAVCTSIGKGDNCEELNTFRRFRDNWLAQTELGEAKINEYYLFAPMIVQAIERSSEKDAVYTDIWNEHLSPCLEMIQAGNLQKCAEKYENMVLELESKWLN